MVEVQMDESKMKDKEGLVIAFCVCTTLLVAVHMLSLMISTCILPNIEAAASTRDAIVILKKKRNWNSSKKGFNGRPSIQSINQSINWSINRWFNRFIILRIILTFFSPLINSLTYFACVFYVDWFSAYSAEILHRSIVDVQHAGRTTSIPAGHWTAVLGEILPDQSDRRLRGHCRFSSSSHPVSPFCRAFLPFPRGPFQRTRHRTNGASPQRIWTAEGKVQRTDCLTSSHDILMTVFFL